MRVADQPPPFHLSRETLDGVECRFNAGLVVHGKKDAREELHHEHHQRHDAVVVPGVQIFGRVVPRELAFDQGADWEATVQPVVPGAALAVAGGFGVHHSLATCFTGNSSNSIAARTLGHAPTRACSACSASGTATPKFTAQRSMTKR